MIHDTGLILAWWLMIFVISFPFIPAAFSLFPGFKDKGYLFSKIIATISISYIVFLLTSLKIICFSRSLIIGITVIVGGALFWWGQSGIKGMLTKKRLKIWVFEELFFLTALLSWALLRGVEPSLNSLEKSMDFGFVNAILRADTMPPQDMWLAGKIINYYYSGHFQAAVMTALSGFSPAVCYNLLIATIFAQVLTSGFSLGGNLISLKKPGPYLFPLFSLPGAYHPFSWLLAATFIRPLKRGKAFSITDSAKFFQTIGLRMPHGLSDMIPPHQTR